MKKYMIGYIRDRQDDFKECFRCKAINWYENESCIECNYENFTELSKYTMGWLEDEDDDIYILV